MHQPRRPDRRARSAALGPQLQYWTSAASPWSTSTTAAASGYGRAYRERLDGALGHRRRRRLRQRARATWSRAATSTRSAWRSAARSAGGYTTLAALTFRDVFQAGASHYGISDLETLARDTHKFESRYLDSLIGPYPARADLYRERSPIHFVDRLSSALILFQGAEDKVVPPSQAEAMYEAVRAKGLPVAFLLFEGEQHGFRQAKNIRRALEAELDFYGRVFGFAPADAIEPVEIENLPPPTLSAVVSDSSQLAGAARRYGPLFPRRSGATGDEDHLAHPLAAAGHRRLPRRGRGRPLRRVAHRIASTSSTAARAIRPATSA